MKNLSLLRKQIRIIDYARFIINFITALMFILNVHFNNGNQFLMSIAWLFMIGWVLGFVERRLVSIRRTRMGNRITELQENEILRDEWNVESLKKMESQINDK